MEIGWYTWKQRNKLPVIFLSLLLIGCTNLSIDKSIEGSKSYKNELSNGVLICRLGTGFFSEYFKKYASRERKFSHIGIVSIENGNYYVYHSEASELTGIGHVKKEPLDSFLEGIAVFDFFEMNYSDQTKLKIIDKVKSYYTHKTPFDLSFDSYDDSELYCTELIAISINQVLNKEVIKPTLILNGKEIYSLDDIYLNENMDKIMFPLDLTND